MSEERDFGPFKLVRRVAVGGMAEVHLARTKGVAGYAKYVAIKMIHPNFAEDEQFINMLIDEARIAVQLNHSNIAQTFDLGRVGDSYYITMEYVDGADLYKILRNASEKDLYLPFDCAAAIAKGVASGLDYAHRKRDAAGAPLNIVHRDVSPQNVLVSYSGEVKLVDFGIAKAALKEQQTAAGVIKGKYYYMSPEQAWGDPVDLRSDVFSAGIVLYEMITGQMLYLEEHLHKLLDMVRQAKIAPPSTIRRDCPRELEKIAMQALAKNPADRYQRAADMAVDLERFLHSFAPTFSGSRLISLLKQTVGEPIEIAPSAPEMRDGPSSTQPLGPEQLVLKSEDIQDENSVLFRLADLKKAPPAKPAPEKAAQAQPIPPTKEQPVVAAPKIPSIRAKQPTAIPAIAPRPGLDKQGARAGQAAAGSGKSGDRGQPASARGANDETRPLAAPLPSQSARDPGEETREIAEPPTNLVPQLERNQPVAAPVSKKPAFVAAQTVASEPPLFSRDAPGVDLAALQRAALEDIDEDDRGESTVITGPGFNLGEFIAPQASKSPDDVDTNDASLDDAGTFDASTSDIATSAVDIGLQTSGDTDDIGDEERPTVARTGEEILAKRSQAQPRRRDAAPQGAANALAASNPTPAVSELRKPRASRRTPGEGLQGTGQPAQPSVLKAIVQAKGGAPMPAKPVVVSQPATASTAAAANPPALVRPSAQLPLQPSTRTPVSLENPNFAAAPPLASQHVQAPGPSSGWPQQPPQWPAASAGQSPPQAVSQQPTAPMPPPGYPSPGVPDSWGTAAQAAQAAHAAQAAQAYGNQAYPAALQYAQYPYSQPGQPYDSAQLSVQQQWAQNGANQRTLGSGAQYGQPGQHQTGQQPNPLWSNDPNAQAPFAVDSLPNAYRIEGSKSKSALMVAAVIAAVVTISVVSYFVVKSNRRSTPITGSVRVESVPSGAAVFVDNKRMDNITPLAIDNLPAGTGHELRIELAKHKPYSTRIEMPAKGGTVPVTAILTPITGKLTVTSTPSGAELYIGGVFRNRTPCDITDLDLGSTVEIELRLKDYVSVKRTLTWNDKTELSEDVRLNKR